MIGRTYPRATGLLSEALDALDVLRRDWEHHVDADPSEVVITTGQGGLGSIMVYPNWRPGSRESLTSALRLAVVKLWECLDSLVIETVDMFAVPG